MSSLCAMENHYPVHYQADSTHQYWFVSVGKRNIIKCIQLDSLSENNCNYNLCLYDFDEYKRELTDSSVSNNGDTEKLFITIAYCLSHFFYLNSKAKITFKGNSESRNRLYRIQINKYRKFWNEDYVIKVITKNQNEFLFFISKMN